MLIAERALGGHLDVDKPQRVGRHGNIGGATTSAVGPAAAAPLPAVRGRRALQGIGRYVIAWHWRAGRVAFRSRLPCLRRQGRDRLLDRDLHAFGSLLWYVSVFGDTYYLAHVESLPGADALLLEWVGRRRPILLGAALAVSSSRARRRCSRRSVRGSR